MEKPSWLIILLLITFFIFYNKAFFDLITTKNCKISLKQKAHVLSLKNSFVMSICGLFFNYYYFFSNKEFDSLYNVSVIIVCFFASYLISDLIIGTKEYPLELGLLTGYIHHIIYIFVTALTIFTGTSHFLVLYFLLEIPTFILSLGTMIAKYRKDHLFGHLFFALRIVFHILLLYLFRKNILLTSISSLALCLHVYWFKNWYQKYVAVKSNQKKMKCNK